MEQFKLAWEKEEEAETKIEISSVARRMGEEEVGEEMEGGVRERRVERPRGFGTSMGRERVGYLSRRD